jgi:hypothetical protein
MANLVLSDSGYAQLKSAGVEVGDLIDTYHKAYSLREVIKRNATESKPGFRFSESAKLSRDVLSNAQEFALSIVAADCAHVKTYRMWGSECNFGTGYVEKAKSIWPTKKPVEAKT